MYTYLLMVFLLLLLGVLLKIHNNDFFSPDTVVVEVYIIGAFFLLIEMNDWNGGLSIRSFSTIIIGIMSFVIPSLLFSKLPRTRWIHFQRRWIQTHTISDENQMIVDIDDLIVWIIDAFSLIIAYKYYSDIKHITGSIASFSSFSDMVLKYREASTIGTLTEGLSSISSHGFLILFALAFVFLYLLIINFQSAQRKSPIWYMARIIPIICFIFCSLVAGSRNPLLQIMIGAFVMYYIIYRSKHSGVKKFKLKLMIKYVAAGVAVLFFFVQLKDLLGRTTEYNVIDYLAEYIGAPIKNFDTFIIAGKRNDTNIWGKETFVNVWKSAGSFLGDDTLANLNMNKEFNFVNGKSLGNVYTALREYYYDFGLLGVVVFPMTLSFIYTSLYRRLRNTSFSDFKSRIDIRMVIYGFISQAIFYFSIDDRFYQAFISTGVIEALAFAVLFCWILPRIKFVIRKRV